MPARHRTTLVFCALAFMMHALPAHAQTAIRVPGYRQIQEEPGVTLWRKGRGEYVQIVAPDRGGRIKLLTGEVKTSFYPGTTFARKDVRDWWELWKATDPNAFSAMNGQFFNMGDPQKAPLAFSTKVDGVIHPGYGDGEEYPGGKMVLLLGNDRYDIEDYDDDAAALFSYAQREALVGLKPEMSKRATVRAGRIFIGVTPEGSAIILATPAATQRYATRILIAFGADRGKILMLDGGGSAQLVTEDGLLVPSKRAGELRTVPQAIGVATGG